MIVVTGGAGFIGSALVWELNNRGIDDVLIVDQLGISEKWKNLVGLKFKDYLEKATFRDLVATGNLDSEISLILHMGACSSTTELNASYLADNNYQFSKEIITFAVSNGIRMIYASSAATYGDGSLGYDDFESIVHLSPMNMYGFSKQMVDCWVSKNNLLDQIVSLKFSNVFGPNEYHKGDMRSVPNKAFHQIHENGTIGLFKSYKTDYRDGEQKRDFIYVKDVVSMVLFFLEHQDIHGIFNIGSGNARTWNELAIAVFDSLGMDPKIEYIEMPQQIRNKYQYYTELPMSKLQMAGYNSPILSLEEGIKDYVQNYLSGKRHLAQS